jgi:hypothetical protein
LRLLYLFIVATGWLSAQALVDLARIPAEFREFRKAVGNEKLDCRVTPIKPRLNYSFRFQTGYVLDLPLRQYEGKGHQIAALLRVTPEHAEREPKYLITNTGLPEVPDTKLHLELGGGFVVGEGKYRVEMTVADSSGRRCLATWSITAKPDKKEDDVPPGLSPGMVDEVGLRRWSRGSKALAEPGGDRHITVLMNVSPILPWRTRLGGYDRSLLLSSLAALLERLPVRKVRLILFNLDQQRELFQDEDFGPSDFGRVANALGTIELGTVDYSTLKNKSGHIDLLTDLIEKARKDRESDAVVFLGPKPWRFDKAPRGAIPQRGSSDPPFFYVQFRPRMQAAAHTDTIMSAVKQMGGKTFDVYTPGDFAAAIREVNKALVAGQGAPRDAQGNRSGDGNDVVFALIADQ